MKNIAICGDCVDVMKKIPDNSIHLVFTSPPYYNAKEYSFYKTYEDYLSFIENVIKEAHRVLIEGRFFVMNISPVIIEREKRSKQSKRLALPFDIHCRFTKNGFDFIEDIIWEKPEYSSKGRSRRFQIDRKPLQYKPSLVTEYVLVYRKHTKRLIEWNVKQYPKDIVEKSKITGEFEKTNIWKINPTRDKKHPAVFPATLARNVILYYSFVGDTVLDPFAGSGTTGSVASSLNRYFFLIEKNENYFSYLKTKLNISE